MKDQLHALYDEAQRSHQMGTLMSGRQAQLCTVFDALHRSQLERPAPAPECDADVTALLLLGDAATLHWTGDRYDWRSAHIASWSVPVACCIKCRGHEVGSGGLSCTHTTHRGCWPEAWESGECRCGRCP